MRLETLEELLARFLGEPQVGLPAVDVGDAAELAAALRLTDGHGRSLEGDPCERLAAYLHGALQGADRRAFEAELAHVPGECEDLESARLFVDAVTEKAAAAPADVLEMAVAPLRDMPRAVRTQGSADRSARRFWRTRTYGVIGGLASVVLAIVFIAPAIMKVGGKSEIEVTALTAAPGGVGTSYMPDDVAPSNIDHPAGLPQGLSHEALSVAPSTTRKLRLPGASNTQEKIASKRTSKSRMNIADDDCQTLSNNGRNTTRNGKVQGEKRSGDAPVAEDCESDVMIGAQIPGIDGPAATTAAPPPDVIGAGQDVPAVPNGPDGN